MKLDHAALEKIYPGLSMERLSKLDPLGRDVALLLLAGAHDPTLDPRQSATWQQWWSQDPNLSWFGVLPKRTSVGQLNQYHRAAMQIGLDGYFHLRPTTDPLFLDTGLLCRLSGMDWPLGLEACLEKLETLPIARARSFWRQAFLHAVDYGKAAASAQLVRWASDQGWAGSAPLIDAEPMASAWLSWIDARSDKKPRVKPLVAFDDVLLDQSLSLGKVRSDPDEEKIFWQALVGSGDRSLASRSLDRSLSDQSLSAWCSRYPGSWDRMHLLALEDLSIPNAWLLTCSQASQEGFDSELWKVASTSTTRDAWLRRLGWGENERLSPLSAWWSHQLSMLDDDDELAAWWPGRDAVSTELRRLGAIEPGSDEEIKLGAKSFAFGVPSIKVNPEWFRRNPQWARNDPLTNSNPIFTCHSTAGVEKWMDSGFSPATVNTKGETAIVAFLSSRLSKNPKSMAVWLGKKFEEGSIPTVGRCAEGSFIERLSLLRNEEVMLAFVHARLRSTQPLPTPQETQELVLHASAPVVHEWCNALSQAGLWSKEMNDALWRGLPFRDAIEDKEVRQDITQRFPFSEDAQTPLWVFCLSREDGGYASRSDTIDALTSLAALGAAPMSLSEEVWSQPKVQETWCALLLDDCSHPGLVPEHATSSWWAQRVDEWLSQTDADGDPTRRNAKNMEGWIRGGLPLSAEVVEVLTRHRNAPEGHSTGARQSPWWDEPSIHSALQHAKLSSTTAPTASRPSPRRF